MSDNPPTLPNGCHLCKPCCAAAQKISALLKQPTSVVGMSAIIGTAAALAMGQITLAQAVPLLAGGVASILFPDNSSAKSASQAMASAIVETLIKGPEAASVTITKPADPITDPSLIPHGVEG